MNWTTQKLWTVFLMLLMVAASSLARAAAAEPGVDGDPQPVVAETINELIERLRKSSDKIRDDQSIAYQISDELVVPRIDFPRVTRLVIGKYWRSATDAQKQQLVDEVKSLLVRSYVTAMSSYVDQIVAKRNRISYLPSRYQPGDNKASVRSSIALEGGQSVEVQYQLYRTNDKWKIYDIVIEGVSLAITYRTSFGEQISRGGLDSLIAQLAERNRKGEVELPSTTTSGTPAAASQ
jgi:phospholipid transport system substrate-binding protein